MTAEPRRKDETKPKEVSEGQKEADEGDAQAVEEYTGYGEGGEAADPEAEREAELQPERARSARKGRR